MTGKGESHGCISVMNGIVSGTGAAGSGMEITPWSSAGNINVKGSN